MPLSLAVPAKDTHGEKKRCKDVALMKATAPHNTDKTKWGELLCGLDLNHMWSWIREKEGLGRK